MKKNGQELLSIGQNLISPTMDERLHTQFLKFLEILQSLIEQEIAVLTEWQQIQADNDALIGMLPRLEKIPARIARHHA